MLCPIALCWIKWTWVWLLHDALRNIFRGCCRCCHYSDVIMSPIASPITSLTIVYSTVYPDADQRKHQSPASLAFVRGIHRRPVNSPHKWPVTREMFPLDDVIMVVVDALVCCQDIYNDNTECAGRYQIGTCLITRALPQRCSITNAGSSSSPTKRLFYSRNRMIS